MLKLLAAFPTSWFTGALAFCLTWVLGTATAEETTALATMRERWKESNVSGDPMAAIASAMPGLESRSPA